MLYLKSPSPSVQTSAHRDTPNILILGSDALRPDHFSGYGYFRDTTPSIDRLIRNGVSFTSAYIEVPRTFPSWVSILTGQFSATHGIRHMFPTSRDLNREFKSIVKVMRGKGYYTSVTGDYAADIFTRINLGFERVDTPYFNFNSVIQQAILENHTFLLPFLTGKAGLRIFPVLRDSAYFCPTDLVRDRVIGEIERAGGKPFFIASFFSSTHFPYAPTHPYYKRYTARDYDGQYRYFKQRTISLEGGGGYEKMTHRDIEQVRALYDGGLRAFDDAVGGIIEHLRVSGRLDNTVVVVLSDHGENLYEGILGMGHGEHFRGSYSTRIPLIIHYPKIAKSRREVTNIVRHVDIAPTLLELAGEKVPPHMEGVSLVPAMKGEVPAGLVAFGETGIWFDNTLREDLFFQELRILYPDITGISEIDFNFDNQIVLSEGYRDLVNLARHRYAHDGRYKLIYNPLHSAPITAGTICGRHSGRWSGRMQRHASAAAQRTPAADGDEEPAEQTHRLPPQCAGDKPAPKLLVCTGNDHQAVLDIETLRELRAATGLQFQRVLSATRRKLADALELERKLHRPTQLLQVTLPASAEGITFVDQVADGAWLRKRLDGVQVLVLSDYRGEEQGEWLRVVPHAVLLRTGIGRRRRPCWCGSSGRGLGWGRSRRWRWRRRLGAVRWR